MQDLVGLIITYSIPIMLVVWAIKDGRDAASAIKTHLENNEIKTSKVA